MSRVFVCTTGTVAVLACGGGSGDATGEPGTSSSTSTSTSAGPGTSDSTAAPTTGVPPTSSETTSSTTTGADTGATTTTTDEPPPDAGTRPQMGAFAWPVDAWISATDFYGDGEPHSGSADLSAPYWTPISAARGGTVVTSKWTEVGGHLVRVDHGGGYVTLYSHLVEPAPVAVDGVVAVGDVIGHVGRTGNAFRDGAHVHFSLERDGERLVIPGITFGDWVERGDPIPGDYAGLAPIELPQVTWQVRIREPLPLLAGPDQEQPGRGTLAAGEIVTVTGSDGGYYRVQSQAGDGWVVHAGTLPALSQLFGVEVLADADVLAGPDPAAQVVGQLEAGELVTVFATSGGYHRFLYSLPTTYQWLASAGVTASARFHARVRAPTANLRSGPGVAHAVVGELAIYVPFIVLEVQGGWYRLTHEGADAWLAGWLTSGRL